MYDVETTPFLGFPIKVLLYTLELGVYTIAFTAFKAACVQRKWRLLVLESLFGGILCLCAVFTARHVFLTPLQDEPEPPLTTADILASLNTNNILGYAPNIAPFMYIMNRASVLLQIEMMSESSEDELNNKLYVQSKSTPIKYPVIWVIWEPKVNNVWKFSIRSTERAQYATGTKKAHSNPHLRAGFLAVQMAISQAILEFVSDQPPKLEVTLVSMPVSPLMQKERVRKTISEILLCLTIALLPPVLEIEALVVSETITGFKRALRIRQVEYSAMYIGWLVYAYLTVLPICLLAALTMILIFRWIHLFFAFLVILVYVNVMIMLALIMAMFHNKASIACVWTTLFTILQTYLAEMLVLHEYDVPHAVVTFLLHVALPPLGLVHALNHFALLQTGHGGATSAMDLSLFYTIGVWSMLIPIYFSILMLLQRTIGQDRAIGGQVSWKSIVFKSVKDDKKLHAITSPTGKERERLQEVEELVAKAISFRNVSKSIMGVKVLKDVTLDIYRGEFTMIITDRVQENLLVTVEDLLSGVTHADSGTINVLGCKMKPGKNYMTVPHMMGYCHSANFLVKSLTVQEHLSLFLEICLANESHLYVSEYGLIRSTWLLKECDLEDVRHEYVRNLDIYYRAQLCWAIAILLEPRIVIIPYYEDPPSFRQVIVDKMMKYKKYLTLVKLTFKSIHLEYADRIFLFDRKILVFGGTPAYMFFKYGREYRLRLTLKITHDETGVAELLVRASQAGATVRAHLGSMLILKLPTTPTANVAEFLKDLTDNAKNYEMLSMYISLPDSEEICRRAIISVSRTASDEDNVSHLLRREALKILSEPVMWRRKQTDLGNITHLKNIAWKYVTFFVHYRLFLILAIISAIIIGILMGLTLSMLLKSLYEYKKIISEGQLLTVEQLGDKTTLVLRLDKSEEAISIANAYVLSETNATKNEIERIDYTAMSNTESLIEYLVTRAIDSPQHYVYMYAYGIDVSKHENDTIVMQVLYSPMHFDEGAAARSLARAYMALMRHYSKTLDASIQVTDDPLSLDLTPWMKFASMPSIFIQFLLILLVSHIILLPSKEHGLIRHMQSHAMNFSPARYWFTLYFCDLILYVMLVMLLISFTVAIMYMMVPKEHFQYGDLLVLPFMFFIYGIACIPQAYMFSLGSRAALNVMSFVIVNVIFGETTVLAKIFYGDALNYALLFMNLSPQFNFAYAYVKIRQTFLYNSECIIFTKENLCSGKTMHKCCQKCGVLQNCFARKSYLSFESGVLMEVIATIADAAIFMTVLLLLEYRVVQRVWRALYRMLIRDRPDNHTIDRLSAVENEKNDVLEKRKQLQMKTKEKMDTFGEYLLAYNVTKKHSGMYTVRNVYLGLGRGEALALSGLKRHGRLVLCEILAGYMMPNEGHVTCMSKWQLDTDPHMYARQITLCCDKEPLPPWMTAYDGLELIAVLRGIPKKYIHAQLKNYLDALDLQDQADMPICRMRPNDRARLRFAATVIGAPPVIVLDECTANQRTSVRRAMYRILYNLRKRGHAIFISSSDVESHMPVTTRLAIILDGQIYDIDTVGGYVERYSNKGYTVVVHLKDEVDVKQMFAQYFKNFVINDSTEVLVNIQVMDAGLTLTMIFEKMEELQARHQQVYSYIVCYIPIDYIYNCILSNEVGNEPGALVFSCSYFQKMLSPRKLISPGMDALEKLIPFEKKYGVTKLKELPWSVIFQR